MTRARAYAWFRGRRQHGLVRRWGATGLLLVLLGGSAGYAWLTDPHRIRDQAEKYLGQHVRGDLRIGAAEFSFFGGTHLIGVDIAERSSRSAVSRSQPASRVAFSCRDLLLRHDPLQALLGRLVVTEVTAVEPTCTLIYEPGAGAFRLADILVTREGARGRGEWRLPTLRLRDASFRALRHDEHGLRTVETLRLDLLAQPDADDSGCYRIRWAGGPTRSHGSAMLDLRSGSFVNEAGGLPWLSLDGALLAIGLGVPGAVEYCELLGLTGQVRAEDYCIAGVEDFRMERGATVRLRGARLSVPIDVEERHLPAEARYLQFRDVDGTIEFRPDGATATFTGALRGSPCEVSAVFRGQPSPDVGLADVGFDIDFAIEDLTFPSNDPEVSPAQARFVARWKKLSDFYRDFDPHGRASLKISVSKPPGTDAPVTLRHALLEGINCDAQYRFFPYRIFNIRGPVEFDERGVQLRDVRGTHGGAPIVFNGWIEKPRWTSAVRLDISGDSVPLDCELHDALQPQYERIWDQFDLTGRADITVQLNRPSGTDGRAAPWETHVQARLADSRVCFAGFPYPVEKVRGLLEITPQGIRVSELTGVAGDGVLVTDGRADLRAGGLTGLHLAIHAERLRFDSPLLGALSTDARELVESFSPEGAFGLAGTITYDRGTGRLIYDLDAAIHDATAVYSGLPLPVDGLSGKLRIRPDRIDVSGLSGRYGDGTVAVRGFVAAGPDGEETHLTVTCRDIRVDASTRDKLPGRIAESIRDLEIDGRIDSVTTLDRTPASGQADPDWRTEIEIKNATARHAALPLLLEHVRGRMSVSAARTTIENLAAEHGDARFQLEGVVENANGELHATGRLRATGVPFDEDLRQAVPWRWRKTWNNVRPDGALDIDLQHVSYRRSVDEAGRWKFDGSVSFNDLALDLGVKVTGAKGHITARGGFGDDAPGLSLSGSLHLEEVSLNDRPIASVHGMIRRSGRSGRIDVDELVGQACHGQATGTVEVTRDDGASRYAVSATLHDADLQDFLNAGRDDELPLLETAGVLTGRLYLSGDLGDPESRRGGGRIDIVDAELFRVPLLTSILNVTDTAEPVEAAFHDLAAEYFVDGREILVKDLVLQGPTLTMLGSGIVALPEKGLEINLVAASPREWGEVPVLTELLEGTSRELMEVRVRGTLEEPVVRARPLRGVGDAVETLIQPKPRPHEGRR